MNELIPDYNQEREICQILSKYSNYNWIELFSLWCEYKSIDLLIKAIPFAQAGNISLNFVCWKLNQ